MTNRELKDKVFDCGNIPCGVGDIKFKEVLTNEKIMIIEIDTQKDICDIDSLATGEKIIIENFSSNALNNGFEREEDVKFLLSLNQIDETRIIRFRHKNGKRGWYIVYKNIICDETGGEVRISGIMCNADMQKKAEENLISRIEFDPLTKVFNRDSAKEKIKSYLTAVNHQSGYALFVLDLDNFKIINDTFGHLYGDAVLTMAAGCIKSSVGEDDIVGRFGGDEFFVFVRNAEHDTIMERANKINRTILSMRKNISDDNDISCSIGIACGTGKSDTYEDLFKKADIALYKSKNDGKNRITVYTSEMEQYESGALDYERSCDEDESRTRTHDLTHIAIEIAARSTSFQNAVHMIMRHIGVALDVDDVKIMRVNVEKDKISIEHHWSKTENVAERDNRTGYYIHDDIMLLRSRFEKNPLFVITDKMSEGFSEKFRYELKKLSQKSVIYSSSLTLEKSFFMLVLSCINPDRIWTEEQKKTVGEVTKILFMYLSKNYQDKIDMENDAGAIEPHTKLLYYDKFYEQSELIRKLAAEHNQNVAVIHIDFNHMYKFNEIYGMRMGEMVLAEYAAAIIRGGKMYDHQMYVATHIYGTDKFIVLARYGTDIGNVAKCVVDFSNKFSVQQYGKFGEYKLVLKIGICNVGNGEALWKKMDEASRLKKNREEPTECVYYIQENNE